MLDWTPYLMEFLQGAEGWNPLSPIKKGVEGRYHQDLILRGVSVEGLPGLSPKLLRRILQKKLETREVVCKLGTGLVPYFLGARKFGEGFPGPRSCPILSGRRTVREVAIDFNLEVDRAWLEGHRLPDPWQDRVVVRDPVTGDPPTEPVDPLEGVLCGEPQVKEALRRLLSDSTVEGVEGGWVDLETQYFSRPER